MLQARAGSFGGQVCNCTGVGDGRLACSGEIHAGDFITASGATLETINTEVAALKEKLAEIQAPFLLL